MSTYNNTHPCSTKTGSWFVKQIPTKTEMPTRILKLQEPSYSVTKKYM